MTTLTKAEKTAKLSDTTPAKPNIIMNGQFTVNQRDDHTTPVAQTTYVDKTISRWSSYTINSHNTSNLMLAGETHHKLNQSGVGDLGVPVNTLRVEAKENTSDAYFGIRQGIEKNNAIKVGETYTLSAWVKTSCTVGGFRLEHINANEGINYGENSPTSKGVQFDNFTTSGAYNWQYLTQTFTVTQETQSLDYIYVWLIVHPTGGIPIPITYGDYIEVANFKLEKGSTATPIPYRSYAEELEMCQRYYERLYYTHGSYIGAGNSTSVSTAYTAPLYFKEKRATPTITLPSSGGAGTTGIAFLTSSGNWPPTTGSNYIAYANKTSARIDGQNYTGLTDDGISMLYVNVESGDPDIYIEIDAEL